MRGSFRSNAWPGTCNPVRVRRSPGQPLLVIRGERTKARDLQSLPLLAGTPSVCVKAVLTGHSCRPASHSKDSECCLSALRHLLEMLIQNIVRLVGTWLEQQR
ncbi:hypothetical protein NDU88_001385 [Pleurodeles waltl]|uniref:Uncharacterized protein n=1 Tax=Pleurodeles waltl TaxID=8319 RepID=A0AAV7R721_PLEWA|nr:hypothetical protein NDU88_001385 [Pleurodeles waltl]